MKKSTKQSSVNETSQASSATATVPAELTERLANLKTTMTEIDMSQNEKTAPKKTTKKAAAKQATSKKAPAKKAAAKKAPAEDGMISLATLAKELKMEPKAARKALRKAGVENPGRWAWKDGSAELAKINKILVKA